MYRKFRDIKCWMYRTLNISEARDIEYWMYRKFQDIESSTHVSSTSVFVYRPTNHRLTYRPTKKPKPNKRVYILDWNRYEQELAVYDGPLKVPNKRAKKDPLAPKRAMSAFLHFSQSMRPRLRDTYPEAKNMDMSKMLGQVRAFFFMFVTPPLPSTCSVPAL